MSAAEPTISPLGDAALLVRFEERIDPALNARVHALAELVRTARATGLPWGAPIPGYASLVVPYDPLRWDDAEAAAALDQIARPMLSGVAGGEPAPGSDAPLEIPVTYGGSHGPDLAEVAERCGVSQSAVVELHAATTYRAYVLGFAPGFAYLAVLPAPLHLPRRDTPRSRVPAGSVAIAGQQTAVYPLSTPGGWHLIGRTDMPIWDPARASPALIAPGRRVRFVPLGR